MPIPPIKPCLANVLPYTPLDESMEKGLNAVLDKLHESHGSFEGLTLLHQWADTYKLQISFRVPAPNGWETFTMDNAPRFTFNLAPMDTPPYMSIHKEAFSPTVLKQTVTYSADGWRRRKGSGG